MATCKYSPHTPGVNRPDRGRDGNLLGIEAFKRAQTLVRDIEESERNRQYLLQGDARAKSSAVHYGRAQSVLRDARARNNRAAAPRPHWAS